MSELDSSSILNYARPPARLSRLAIVAMALGIVGLLTFFFVVPSLVALFLGLAAAARIRREPGTLTGAGFAQAAVTMSLIGFGLFVVAALLMPTGHHPRELSNRSVCAVNLRGIAQAMNVYAADNSDKFPIVTYAPYAPALNAPTATATLANADRTLETYYRAPFPQAGSVSADLWILVLKNQVSPKQFLCKSDRFAAASPALMTDAAGNFYNNFQSDAQLSYSFAYPWNAKGEVGPWWTSLLDSSLPIACDMAPQSGTGMPRRITNPASAPAKSNTWNSDNHQGDGQNVAFSDAHAEFTRRPDVGPDGDNMFTTSGRPSLGPAQFGGLPADRMPPQLSSEKPPFDIIMYPSRNLDTGAL